jgi:hypothetical protein
LAVQTAEKHKEIFSVIEETGLAKKDGKRKFGISLSHLEE